MLTVACLQDKKMFLNLNAVLRLSQLTLYPEENKFSIYGHDCIVGINISSSVILNSSGLTMLRIMPEFGV